MLFDAVIKPALDATAAILNNFHESPEQKQAAQQAIADLAEKARKDAQDYEISMAKLSNEDRDSARKREMGIRGLTPAILSIGVTSGFFGILSYMCLYAVPPESKDMLNIMLGSLGAAWVSIVSYYFGSSSDSSRKTELLSGK
ncbi:MAG TPA: hypothetical protein VFO46_02385 [Candidatus Sulfotelmatobacter sp.]|nr:hypothetical protein [Candidatus Sulfotelmatobacter sp.]